MSRPATGCCRGVFGAFFTVALAVVTAAAGCAGPRAANRAEQAGNPVGSAIAVLAAADNAISRAVIEGFSSAISAPVSVFYAEDAAAQRKSIESIEQLRPRLLVTLGGRAAALGHRALGDVPMIYALVLKTQAFSLVGEQAAGVALELPAATEFTLYKLVMPGMQRVLAFYDSAVGGTERIEESRRQLQDIGVELVTFDIVGDVEKITAGYEKHASSVDAVWLPAAAGVMTGEVFARLRKLTLASGKPFLCSTFREFARDGALMSVSLDYANVAEQVAMAAKMIIEQGQHPSSIGMLHPVGGRLVLNKATAQRIGLTVPPMVRPLVSEVFTSIPVPD